MADMLESASAFVEEYAALEHQLADPAIHRDDADPAEVRKLNKRYAALAPTVAAVPRVARGPRRRRGRPRAGGRGRVVRRRAARAGAVA